jgi:hypothetical protein
VATRLFLRATDNNGNFKNAVRYPTTGEKSTALPTGTLNVDISNEYYLSTSKTTFNGSDIQFQITSLAQTATQSSTWGNRFSSESLLSAQTISANTWTIFYKSDEANNNANAFLGMSIYVWRPTTNSVVGFIYDSTTQLGTEFGTTASTQSVTVSGSAVTANRGDILVCEPWTIASQGASKSYSINFYIDGTNETTTGTGNTSCAAYIETPQNLNFINPKSSVIFVM